MLRRAAILLIALTALVCVYGFVRGRLWEQEVWAAAGWARFLWYTGVYWAVAGALVWLAPRWFAWITAGGAVLYTAWWVGVAAPVATLYFLGSCWGLGRLVLKNGADAVTATLAGAALWMALLWTALHFPVNTPWVYGFAFAFPYIGLRGASIPRSLPSRREAAGCAALLYILFAHGLAALKPDISADALSMHLALPMEVALRGEWAFDFQHEIWALMPAGGDALFTGVYLLGGEAAAQLLNVAFLTMTALLIRRATGTWWAAALFASTPLVLLVTGSLFVENVWAAFVVAAALSMQRSDVRTGALFAGAAMMVKLIAAAFVLPLLLWGLVLKRRDLRTAAAAALVFAALAAPVYLYAWARSGNPVFPFANTVFQSPHYYTDQPFTDARYENLPVTPRLPYDLTFHSSRYVEGKEGAAGFQYLLLLPAALLLALQGKPRDRAGIAAVALIGGTIVLAGAPNLRYLYGAIPLASIMIGWLDAQKIGTRWIAAAIIPLNLWFLPSSGWYNTEFALFRHSDIAPYLTRYAPERLLIDRLNREAPGQPVAFFSTGVMAGLAGKAYTDTWHHEHYWEPVRNSPDAAAVAAKLRALGIEHIVAPVSRQVPFQVVQTFLEKWLDPEGPPVSYLALYRLRDEAIVPPRDTRPLSSGVYDDLEPRIEYTGAWLHDPQWAEAASHSLTYSPRAGDTLRLTFSGTAITYIHTKAANRGTAEVRIDGRLRRVGQRSAATLWQQRERFAGLPPGEHTFEIRVRGDGFVDLDALEIEE